MTILTTPDSPRAFLEFLHGDARDGFVVSAFKDPANMQGLTQSSHRVIDRDSAAQEIVARSERENVYICPSVFRGRKRTEESIIETRVVFLDRDGATFPRRMPTPTLTMETSQGSYQDFWRLDHPIPGAAACNLLRRIAAACGCSMAATSPAQPMRVPGTPNRKPERHGEMVRIVDWNPYARTVPGSFGHLPPVDEVPRYVPNDVTVDVTRGQAVLARVHLSPRMRKVARGANTRHDGSEYESRSEGDAALVLALVRADLSDDDIASAFMASPRGTEFIARKGRRGMEKRLARLIGDVRAFAASHAPLGPPATVVVGSWNEVRHAPD